MTERSRRVKCNRAGAWILALALAGCGSEPASRAQGAPERAGDAGASLFAAAPDRRWRLPPRLREISGLATTPDGRLFGHGDEAGIVYELDNETGRISKNFALGDPVEHADFEGLAITQAGDFHLVTSAGRLYRFREGDDGEHVGFETFDTGLQRVCEVEGLAYSAAADSLILACKRHYAAGMRDAVALYSWPLHARAAAQLWLRMEALEADLHPSAIELDRRSGRIVLLAARERALVEIDPDGAVVAARRLDERHVQAEGVAILPDGALVIADEAAGGRAFLTRYPRQ
jgi:uncharacterized protein YjiK